MDVLAALLPLADAATEGKKVIFGMLITGLVFVAVIVLGETSQWLKRRRGAAHYRLRGALSTIVPRFVVLRPVL